MDRERIVAELRRRTDGMSQVQIGRMLGLSQAAVSEIFRGQLNPALTKTQRCILEAFPDMLPLFLSERTAIANGITPQRSEG